MVASKQKRISTVTELILTLLKKTASYKPVQQSLVLHKMKDFQNIALCEIYNLKYFSYLVLFML